MRVFAPGKLILSGEHAVVYGKPALAMAVNRYVVATVTHEHLPQILFDLSNLTYRGYLSACRLHHLKERIKRKYHRFIRGDFSICDVLQKPFELAQFAFSVFSEAMNISLSHGMKIKLESDIPMGCGMGSSAATILGVMYAISKYLHIPLSSESLFQLALEAEHAQHGRSSGLDLRVTLSGGCLYMQDQTIQMRQLPLVPMYLINTGSPATTTGQSVERVAPYFRSQGLGDEFAAVTNAIDAALQVYSYSCLQQALRANHRLLVDIGVVPKRVQQFITQIEAQGDAAKICGAGAVEGDKAGIVLAISHNRQRLKSLCTRFGYPLLSVSCESRGLHAV